MAKPKNVAYVVWHGRQSGVYDTWAECESQVKGFAGAKFKGFTNLGDAEYAFTRPHSEYVKSKVGVPPSASSKQSNNSSDPPPTGPYIAVDAAFGGHPKRTEWRGVLVEDPHTSTQIFRSNAYTGGSANVGEFIAIIDALLWCQKNNISYPIYSDSINAQLWIKRGQHASKVYSCDALASLLVQCNDHLQQGLYHNRKRINPLRDWNTKLWGEIPADFGRKSGPGLPVSSIVHK